MNKYIVVLKESAVEVNAETVLCDSAGLRFFRNVGNNPQMVGFFCNWEGWYIKQ